MFHFSRNYASILYRFRVIASFSSNVVNFNPPHLHLSPLYRSHLRGRKIESQGYRVALFVWSYV